MGRRSRLIRGRSRVKKLLPGQRVAWVSKSFTAPAFFLWQDGDFAVLTQDESVRDEIAGSYVSIAQRVHWNVRNRCHKVSVAAIYDLSRCVECDREFSGVDYLCRKCRL